jgi:hypothetical protein
MKSSDPFSLINSSNSLPPSISSLTNLLSQYLSNTLLPHTLSLSIQSLLQNPQLPKNPYFKLIRDLRNRISQNAVIEGFDELLKKFQISDIQEDSSNFGLGRLGGVWGLKCLMQWMDARRIEEVMEAVGDIGVEMERKGQDFEVLILNQKLNKIIVYFFIDAGMS